MMITIMRRSTNDAAANPREESEELDHEQQQPPAFYQNCTRLFRDVDEAEEEKQRLSPSRELKLSQSLGAYPSFLQKDKLQR